MPAIPRLSGRKFLGGLFNKDKSQQTQPKEETKKEIIHHNGNKPATTNNQRLPEYTNNKPEASSNNDSNSAKANGDQTTQSLWEQAYNKLDKTLVKKYEVLLARGSPGADSTSKPGSNDDPEDSLDESTEIDKDHQGRQAQLDGIIKDGLQRMDKKKVKYEIAGHEFVLQDQIAQAAGVVEGVKGFISQAVSASPQASLAWAGVCIILPLLTNPSTAVQANESGFTYVTSRMRYYVKLEPLLLPRNQRQDGDVEKLNKEFEIQIVELYQNILNFQLRSVLRFYRSWRGNLVRDAVQYDDWKGMLQKIKDLEQSVDVHSTKINTVASRQELEDINKNTGEIQKSMQNLLGFSEQQLRVAEEHRDISSKQLEVAEKQLQMEEDKKYNLMDEKYQEYHRLFRLTRDEKDNTYEFYKDRVQNRLEGTCQWFLTQPNLKSWMKQDTGLLVVSADPGCGKSVLSKYLIDHWLPKQSTTICYFFFKDPDQNTAKQALCALLHQLFIHKPSLLRHVESEYKQGGNGAKLVDVASSLQKIFENALSDPEAGSVIFVIDALDECKPSDREYFTKMLETWVYAEKGKAAKAKFLFTTRPYQEILSTFQGFEGASPSIHIPGENESDAIGHEVNQVIKSRVEMLATKKKLSTTVKDHLQRRLLEISNRTYLWVYLVFDYLESHAFRKTAKGIDAEINNLPKGVDEAYEKMLSSSDDIDTTRKVLSIMLAGYRPLTIREMNIALNTDESTTSIEDVDPEPDEDFKERLRNLCGFFISIHDDKVQFLHQTAREFLLQNKGLSHSDDSSSKWKGSISIEKAHSVLALSCIVYIDAISSSDETDFIDYCAENWGPHYREASLELRDDMEQTVLNMCNPETDTFRRWFLVFSSMNEPPEKFNTLLLAAHFGLKDVVNKLLQQPDSDCDCKDGTGMTPLLYATFSGHEPVVKLLIEKGANIESKGREEKSALSYAADEGYEGLAKLLIEKGANMESRDESKYTPLILATQKGNEAIVKLLIDKGADPKAKDGSNRTALTWAAEESRTGIMKILINKGADLESHREMFDRSPLGWAVKNDSMEMIKLLIDKGADINSVDDMGRTLLSEAASNGNVELMKMFINKGADVNFRDRFGRTPIARLALIGLEEIGKILIDNGADINIKDSNNMSPLSWATNSDCEAFSKLLVDEGAEIEFKDGYGLTPLMQATITGNPAIVKLLIDKGAGLESKDNDGQTPLVTATRQGNHAVVKLLVEKGADLESKDDYGQTPLIIAAREGNLAVVKLLVERGADVEAKDLNGRTHLSIATKASYQEVVDILTNKRDSS